MSVKPAPSAVCSLGSSPQTRAREGVREGAHPADSGRTGDLKVIGALIAAVAQGPPSCTFPHTVKTHVHNAFAKLGIASRAQLAQLMRGSN